MIIYSLYSWMLFFVVTTSSSTSNVSSVTSSSGLLLGKNKTNNYNEDFEVPHPTVTTEGEEERNTDASFSSELYSINAEDISDLLKIKNYYINLQSGELPEELNKEEIEKHRIFLTKIFNRVAMSKNRDSKLNNNLKELLSAINHVVIVKNHEHKLNPNLKELLSTITNITDQENPTSNLSSSTSETNTNHSQNGSKLEYKKTLLTHDSTGEAINDDANLIVESPLSEKLSKKTFVFLEKYNPKLPFEPGINQPHINKSIETGNSKNTSNFEGTLSTSSTFSKRFGEHVGDSALFSPLKMNRYSPQRHQNNLAIVYQGSTLAPILQPQGVKHRRGAMNQGMYHLISQTVRNSENITASPLTITDTAALEEDISKKLLEILIQANKGGSVSNYNHLLETALAELIKSPTTNVENSVPAIAKPAGTSNYGSGPGLVEVLSPEVLASLLVRLQLPTTEELTKIRNQIADLVNLVDHDTRLETVNATSLATILMTISTAIISIISSLSTLCTNNPLICVLTAVAIFALIYHIHKHKKGNKKYPHKDSGYGHQSSGGYHRKNYYDYDEYRMLDEDTQAEVASDILGKIDVFDDWLQSVKEIK